MNDLFLIKIQFLLEWIVFLKGFKMNFGSSPTLWQQISLHPTTSFKYQKKQMFVDKIGCNVKSWRIKKQLMIVHLNVFNIKTYPLDNYLDTCCSQRCSNHNQSYFLSWIFRYRFHARVKKVLTQRQKTIMIVIWWPKM